MPAVAASFILVLAGGLAAALPAGASSSRPLLQSEGAARYKPNSFCPANQSCFTHARWTKWGTTAVAWAHGTTFNPPGPAHSGRAKVILSRPEAMCGGVRYTRARWRYPAFDYPDNGWIHSVFEELLDSGACGFWTGA
jgi:hypothetical protein